MREMLEQAARSSGASMLDRYDLGGVYDDIARQLDEIVEQEREGIDRRVDEARQSGDKRREELLEELAQQRRQELDQLPPDLAGPGAASSSSTTGWTTRRGSASRS